jgi:hypothetical protein
MEKGYGRLVEALFIRRTLGFRQKGEIWWFVCLVQSNVSSEYPFLIQCSRKVLCDSGYSSRECAFCTYIRRSHFEISLWTDWIILLSSQQSFLLLLYDKIRYDRKKMTRYTGKQDKINPRKNDCFPHLHFFLTAGNNAHIIFFFARLYQIQRKGNDKK